MRAPRFAELLLSRVLTGSSRDAMLGDLAEDYTLRRRRDGRMRARLWYWKQLFASLGPATSPLEPPVTPRRSPPERNSHMDTLAHDLRDALRSLRGAPGFTFGSVATLVLGLGITAVMFTVVYGVLARPLPYEEPARLIAVGSGSTEDPERWGPTSFVGYELLRDNGRAFEQLAAHNRFASFTLRLGEDPERVRAARVSANYFSTLGVAPMLGRDFRREEDEVGSEPVTILSHELWVSRFGADPDIVGRQLSTTSSQVTVIGVMPPDFVDIHQAPRMWTSMARETRRANTNSLYLVGRLRDGITEQQARDDLERMRLELERSDAEVDYEVIRAQSLHGWVIGDTSRFLRIAGGAAVLVMLIVIANLSNLALVHGAGRAKELAVRAAMGAGARRIARLLFTEAFVLGLLGALPAIAAAWWGVGLFLNMTDEIPRHAEIGIDAAVIAFTLMAGVLVTAVASLAAGALGRRRDLAHRLRAAGTRSASSSLNNRAQGALAVAQLALALALLLAVGLLLRSLVGLQAVDTGFVPRGALVVELSAPSNLEAGAERRGFYEELVRRIESLPGVEHAGAVSFLPFTGWSSTGLRIDGMPIPPDPDDLPSIEIDAATPGFFAAMGTPIVAGRGFSPADDEGAPRVAVINRAMAERYWPGEDPLGRRLYDQEDEGTEVELTIIGVAENVRARGVDLPATPKLYTAYKQSEYWWPFGMNVVVRSATPPADQAQPVRDVLRGMVAQPPLAEFTTLEEWLAEEFAGLRFQTSLFGVFALVATLLACVGLYGVIASGVARRTHEIGVRMALGADANRMLRGVVGAGVRLGVIGTLAGIPLALFMARSLESMLFGVSGLDLPTLVVTAVALNVVAIIACWLPARRASRVAPLEAIRD